jgi:hypothetical protein
LAPQISFERRLDGGEQVDAGVNQEQHPDHAQAGHAGALDEVQHLFQGVQQRGVAPEGLAQVGPQVVVHQPLVRAEPLQHREGEGQERTIDSTL